jgi:hypothetical protein
MLIVTQKEDAWITIEAADGVDLSMTLRDALAHEPILIKLIHIGQGRVRLGIQASRNFRILRGSSPSAASGVGSAIGTATATISSG